MKQNNSIQLESKEVKQLIARALGIDVSNVISTHYGFGIINVTAEVLSEKFKQICIV